MILSPYIITYKFIFIRKKNALDSKAFFIGRGQIFFHFRPEYIGQYIVGSNDADPKLFQVIVWVPDPVPAGKKLLDPTKFIEQKCCMYKKSWLISYGKYLYKIIFMYCMPKKS